MKLKDLTSPFGRNRNNKRTEDNDLGFGTKITASGERLINPDGSFNIRRTGRWTWTPYQDLVEMSWPLFLLLIGMVFVGINALFATGFFWIGIEALSGVGPVGNDPVHASTNDNRSGTVFLLQRCPTSGPG